ncbi:YafY family transcriptional regulator [Pseudonocardia sp. DSM 110487]|uniref:helix-turn-helix transcriptional regulator n=1 Tax=Pseudonocardia sp. DSM 110487 TaxID=2865833 RepID=UPI001C694CFA|nr:YafY family protein [Pseudonocardia sp. DSM 110487]QYN34726.1 YafY family transcriptional regulator [Pseudonocardia sp. DSM 110487]
MLETSARLLRLLSLLQSRREWTGPELAQRLEVSERTIRNDIDRLRSLGYPVDANRGAVGGYRLGAGAQLPPLLLDDDEAVATVLGLRAATGLAGVEEVSLRALAKIEQVLPRRLRTRVAALGEFALRVPEDTPSPQVDAEVLTTLAAACRDAERLRFDYRTHGGGESRRDVEPYRLIAWGRRWYLLAWDVERGDWRTFRADRITPRIPTGPRFAPRPLPTDDVTTYLSGRVSAAAWRYRARVVVHAPADEVAERITAAVGHVEARDAATCVLHTGSDSLESLAVHLGMLGVDFEVVDPPELADHIALLSERYARAVRRA